MAHSIARSKGESTDRVRRMALDSSNLGRLQRVTDLRAVWPSEPSDFTPWLAENIDVLGDELGMTLSVINTEVPVGEFTLDVHAEDEQERTVVIENQLTVSDHSHLGQSLVYAAGMNAAAVVWVSTRFREDHRSVLDWLNENTDSGIGFFAVEVSVVQIGENSAMAPVFTVVSRPNDWQKSIKTSGAGATEAGNPLNADRHEFYNEVLVSVNAQRRKINIPARNRLNWVSFAFGSFGNWGLVFSGKELRVEIYLDLKEKTPTKRLFDELEAERELWETKVEAGELRWERLDESRACRISAHRIVDLDNPDSRTQGESWCERTLIAMYDTFDAHLRAAAPAARSAATGDEQEEPDWTAQTETPSPTAPLS